MNNTIISIQETTIQTIHIHEPYHTILQTSLIIIGSLLMLHISGTGTLPRPT